MVAITEESPKYEEIKEYFECFIMEMDNDIYAESKESDIHNYAFNTDYYIIGRHKAKQWCGDDTWEIIQTVVEYEKENFGEVSTPIDEPERVVNMYSYIVGEQVVYDYFTEANALGAYRDPNES
jgi:hypothetical protein